VEFPTTQDIFWSVPPVKVKEKERPTVKPRAKGWVTKRVKPMG
jgi:hypothetical protein